MNQENSIPIEQKILNKVPEVTLYFWIIKVLCTTVGETAADFLNINLNFGLSGTSIVTGVLLVVALLFQFRYKKYIPGIYWLTVVLISVFGTLVTDNLTDTLGVPLEASTIFFSVALGLIFLFWYLKEKTLSVHSIFTARRETFYWLAILFTFALGTASGDLLAEGLGLGYLVTGIIVAIGITVFAVAQRMKLNPVLSFWLIYILTRPLGASLGDLLSQPASHGGLGLGATLTSSIFLLAILGTVAYLSLTKKDVIKKSLEEKEIEIDTKTGGLWQVVITLGLIIVISWIGYQWRSATLQTEISNQTTTDITENTPSLLGDLTVFRTITQDTLDLLNQGKLPDATTRIADLEYEWDNAKARLRPMSKTKWNQIDAVIDTVLRQLRSRNIDIEKSKSSLKELLTQLN